MHSPDSKSKKQEDRDLLKQSLKSNNMMSGVREGRVGE
jgi:hypothetical protein